ncbi:MAG: ABC transporter permease subunit [Phycisphaerales bacterium]|nr:ABC transporter permease subunit [Phycisphaerales bacterium]
MATPLLAFLALGLASQSIAGELAQGTLRNLLLRPIRRGTVLVRESSPPRLARRHAGELRRRGGRVAGAHGSDHRLRRRGGGDAQRRPHVTHRRHRHRPAPDASPAERAGAADLLRRARARARRVGASPDGGARVGGRPGGEPRPRPRVGAGELAPVRVLAFAAPRHLAPARVRRSGLRSCRCALPRRRARHPGRGRVGGGGVGRRRVVSQAPRGAVMRGR